MTRGSVRTMKPEKADTAPAAQNGRGQGTVPFLSQGWVEPRKSLGYELDYLGLWYIPHMEVDEGVDLWFEVGRDGKFTVWTFDTVEISVDVLE